ncbi:MAG: hypothetical protein P8018_13945 [Acidobacteriota bacterium]
MNAAGTTFLLNSHVLSEVEMVCNRVAIMDRGKVVVQDDLSNLLRTAAENYTAETTGFEDAPRFVTVLEKMQDRVRCRFPAENLGDFTAFVRERGLIMTECRLDRMSLEEAFFERLGEGGHA